ncbi:hypothetical protein ACNI3Q_11460 [Sphingomonas sp. FW199]|uniref:hypothetical protein n=1 Tax=Sphingomonas sp. FW199 TaxID=3400217 RepID=UPI003CF2B12B
MAQPPYRENAARARAEADAAILDNVRDRALRSEAAWLHMADRQDRTDRARAERERAAATAPATPTAIADAD